MDNEQLPICILGSGLSGVSAAKALQKSGKKVLMLDPGLEPSDATMRNVTRLSQVPAWQWDEKDINSVCDKVETEGGGVKEKLLFNSNFSSQSVDAFPIQFQDCYSYTSFAKGGLSNIWGAGLLPMGRDEFPDWPVSYRDLEPHYKEVLTFMPLAGRHDPLEELLPLHCEPGGYSLSRQASMLMARMQKKRSQLKDQGVYFGASRLAAQFHGRHDGMDCQYCGMCMYGCPYGVLYSSRQTIDGLCRNEHFTYRPGFLASHIKEEAGIVRIFGTDLQGNSVEPIEASKCLVACGAPATTKIMLRSLELFNKPVELITNDFYYLPLFTLTGHPNVDAENLHTMCQMYWIVDNPKISPHMVHCSLYTYNDFYEKAISNMFGPVYGVLKPVLGQLLQRLFFVFCYVHSDHSSRLRATLQNDALSSLLIEGIENRESKSVFKKVRTQIRKVSRYTGLHAVPFYKSDKLPGESAHLGGAFPMKKQPLECQTDIWGRMPGLQNTHIVDSSVFPSITATTISLTIMANAHRIATKIASE
jgi:choline dehydrogenase-like flavoprotein